ncbi:DUF4232 domain-containing protein [Streptomyces sp. G1]|uniref:DUF4232 domain-containing protein n=1 Tax=Streptomyces sp. G1 TaxID=361572 RepID=UPI002030076C|nr:DUF4232 domain-containing protein [Streptomyces sp. G1]MCM1972680.1 DUF4232 domain-containing protein [Streptomyces sp. G1]
MPTPRRAVPAVLLGALLLAACGTEKSEAGGGGDGGGGDGRVARATLCPSQQQQYGVLPSPDGADGADEATPTARPSGTPSEMPLPPSDGQDDEEVRVTGLYAWGPGSGCDGVDYSADFEVTNNGPEEATYSITFAFGSSGQGMEPIERTVEAVGAGRTVKGTVVMRDSPPAEAPTVDILSTRSVPTAEVPTQSGPCPKSGMHVYADRGDAAMGLRVVGLHVVNCGEETLEFNGYPELELFDEDHEKVTGVRILEGTGSISTGLGDDTVRPVSLAPGEAAQAQLSWRNTTEFGDPVNAPYVRVRAAPGDAPVMVTPELDLGTTGKLGVGPWQKDENYRAPETEAPATP